MDEPKTDLELEQQREKRGSTTTESGEEYDDASSLLPGSVPSTPLRRTRSGSPRRDRSPSKAAAMREDQLRVVSLFTGGDGTGGEGDGGVEARTLSPGRSSSRCTSPGRGSSRRSPERSPVRHRLLRSMTFHRQAFLTSVFVLPQKQKSMASIQNELAEERAEEEMAARREAQEAVEAETALRMAKARLYRADDAARRQRARNAEADQYVKLTKAVAYTMTKYDELRDAMEAGKRLDIPTAWVCTPQSPPQLENSRAASETLLALSAQRRAGAGAPS